jgi:hypothetical protein
LVLKKATGKGNEMSPSSGKKALSIGFKEVGEAWQKAMRNP